MYSGSGQFSQCPLNVYSGPGAGPNAEDTEMTKTQTLSLRTSQFIKGLTQMISTYPLKEQHRTEVHSPGLGWGREWNS